MISLVELVARCEQAAEGSRELDLDISEVAGKCGTTAQHLDMRAFQKRNGRLPNDPHDSVMGWLPHYSTSLDAALTLAPEGVEWELTNLYGMVQATVGLNTPEHHSARRKDGNVILALVSACLRARAQDQKPQKCET